MAQQGTQRHDKHVRPPAGFSAGKRPTASYLTRLARTARGGLFALHVTRRGHWRLGAWRLGGGFQEAWKRLRVPRRSGLGRSDFMKSTSREGNWRLKWPKLHPMRAKRKARKAKETPKMTKLTPQMVPRPPQDASIGSLGGDFRVFLKKNQFGV